MYLGEMGRRVRDEVTTTVRSAQATRFADARCHGADAELFFGPPGIEPRGERMRRETAAKAVCRECPAMLACRQYALDQGEVYGVWGGLGEQERRLQLVRLGRIATSA
jgi:WhiB family transcriptional regulator, redox-sensing transcriptional regulator